METQVAAKEIAEVSKLTKNLHTGEYCYRLDYKLPIMVLRAIFLAKFPNRNVIEFELTEAKGKRDRFKYDMSLKSGFVNQAINSDGNLSGTYRSISWNALDKYYDGFKLLNNDGEKKIEDVDFKEALYAFRTFLIVANAGGEENAQSELLAHIISTDMPCQIERAEYKDESGLLVIPKIDTEEKNDFRDRVNTVFGVLTKTNPDETYHITIQNVSNPKIYCYGNEKAAIKALENLKDQINNPNSMWNIEKLKERAKLINGAIKDFQDITDAGKVL